jgi:hypothetical protein
MRYVLLLMFVLVGCTKPNKDFCCASEAQCAALGSDELRPCQAGLACAAGTCVAKECDTSADCTDATKPVCILNLCEAKCESNADCSGLPDQPLCASDGVCVGCIDSSQCPADKNICDAEDRSCRGCELDDECPGGVCIESSGMCVADAEVVFVSSVGADSGTCTRAAPCASLGFGFQKVNASRPVMHLLGGKLNVNATVSLTAPVTIDGTNNMLTAPATGAMFAVSNSAHAALENVMLGTANGAAITVQGGGSAELYATTLSGSGITVSNGGFAATASTFTMAGVTCSNGGTVTVETSSLSRSGIDGTACAIAVRRNRFDDVTSHALFVDGGSVLVENNLLITPSEFVDMIHAGGGAPGSTIRFNTFVNTSSLQQSPVAIDCDASIDVTSNLFAYNSTNPISGSGCVAHASLFDLPGAVDAGAGNFSGDAALFFVDRGAGDFHLAAQSPALERGEPALISVDLEGHPRPSPAGSAPDIGAFEAP